MKKIAIIDGDIISYRCAAANEKRTVEATHKDTLESLTFDTATKFKEWAGEDADKYALEPKQEAAAIENALHSLKSMIKSITEKAKCDSYHVVVSGGNNFRQSIPLPTKYKDSRKENVKPLQLKECRDYLIKVHSAEIAEGEADDLLVEYAVQGYKDGDYIVQCSIDKDAKHGPGWLYDWTTMTKPELIKGFGALELILKDTGKKTAKGEPAYKKSVKGKGRAFLFYQMLYGDSIDCYSPKELANGRLGEAGAYDLLKGATNDKEALEVLVAQYKRWYPKPVTYKAWDEKFYTKNWMEIWQMYADCAFMRRWKDDRFIVEDVLNKLKVEY